VPPPRVLEYRALLETCHGLRAGHTAWVQRIHAVFFHQGAPRLGEGFLRSEQGMAALRAASAAHLSPAGQMQIGTALEMIAVLETRLHDVRRQVREAAAALAGARARRERLYGVGPARRPA
jgi:transposase